MTAEHKYEMTISLQIVEHLYYDQLLANAETLYADFIAKNSSLASLETLINSIG